MEFWSDIFRLFSGASEFWAAIIGALIGGLITFGVEQQRNRATADQEWRRVQDEDLRSFQRAVLMALDALEVDLGTAHAIGLSNLAEVKWHPIQSHLALQDATLLATRIRDTRVRSEWDTVRGLLEQSKTALQVAMHAVDPQNPLVKLIPPEAQELVKLSAPDVFNSAFFLAARAREASDGLWNASEEAFKALMENRK